MKMLKSVLVACALTPVTLATTAQADALTDLVLDQHIIPYYQNFADQTAALNTAAAQGCDPDALKPAFSAALEAWVAVSHLRFGPSETDNRAFAIAFWPDTRSKTPKALTAMITKLDDSVNNPKAFKHASIAVRGLYPLEYLLYDVTYHSDATADYTCQLIRAITQDTATNAHAILTDWQGSFANEMRATGDRYQTDEEAHQEIYKALNTGLEILSDMRLGRPLGSFDAPRPHRAETWRSGHSLINVQTQLAALRDLALLLAKGDADLSVELAQKFDHARTRATLLENDPIFAGVSDPQQRFRIEALQQEINDIKTLSAEQLGPKLGVLAGFNALDGD